MHLSHSCHYITRCPRLYHKNNPRSFTIRCSATSANTKKISSFINSSRTLFIQRELNRFTKLTESTFAFPFCVSFSTSKGIFEKVTSSNRKKSKFEKLLSSNLDLNKSETGSNTQTNQEKFDFIMRHLNQINVIGEPEQDLLKDSSELGFDESKLTQSLLNPPLAGQSYPINQVLKMWRHTKVMPGKRVHTFAALVVIGTGTGSAGLGYGKGNTPARAVERATRNAQRSILTINLYKDCALPKDYIIKNKRCKIMIKAVRPGYGLRGNYEMRTIMQAFGIKDAIVHSLCSRRNKIELYRSIWKAFATKGVPLPEDVARITGTKFFSRAKAWYNRGD